MVSTDIASNAPFQQEAFLGASTKFRKATIKFVMYVRPSVGIEELGSHLLDFREIRYFNIFRNSVEKIQVSLKCDKNVVYLT